MTKQEILALIDAKVAGRGNQLDLGGGVVEALKEILNIIPEGGGGLEPLLVEGSLAGADTVSVSAEDFEKIGPAFNSGRVVLIILPGDGYSFYVTCYSGADYYGVADLGAGSVIKYTIVSE